MSRLRLIGVALGLLAGLASVAQAYPSASIYKSSPSGTVYTGTSYAVTADSWDDMGNLLSLTMTRDGSYVAGASGSGWSTYNLSATAYETAPGTATTRNYYMSVDSTDYSNSASTSVTIVQNYAPVTAFDYADSSVVRGANLTASGWAADYEMGAPVSSVKMYIDGTYISNATLGGDRPDVASALAQPTWRYSGFSWSYAVTSSSVSLGSHTLKAVAFDNLGASTDMGTKNFTVVNTAPTVSASATSIYVNGTSTVSWSSSDVDANFNHVEVYVTQWGSPYWDYLGSSSSASGTMNWSSSAHFNSANAAAGAYLFVVRAVDGPGAYTDSYGTFDITNRAPSAAMSIKDATSGTVAAVTGETLTITVSGSDADGNLRAVNLWVATPNTSWRNIRSNNTLNGGFVENNTSDNAISSGGANVSSLGAASRTFYIPLSEGVGTYQFVTRSFDAYTNSASQQVNVTVTDPAPVNQSVTVGGTFTYGQTIPMSTRSTDSNGDLTTHHIVVSNSSYTSNSWEGADPSGWKWHHFMSVAAVSGSDSTVSFNLRDDNYGFGTNLPVGTYHVTINGQDALPNYTYDASRVMATFTITKATPTVSWGAPAAITYGTALSSTQLSATASVPGAFSYTPSAGTVLNAGASQTLSVTFTPTDTANYNSVSTSTTITVNKAGASVTLGSLLAAYNGSPKAATATTSPSGLTVSFTYNGSGTAPSALGSYTVVGTVVDSNYTGSAVGTLNIVDPAVDADGDGMPNGWEIAHGLNPNDPADASAASASNAGLTNRDCYRLGLEPGTNSTPGDLGLKVHRPN